MRADARRKYDRILEVAIDVWFKQGIDASLNEVARRAAVGPGTLYRHFPTREDLLNAVMKDWVERIQEEVAKFYGLTVAKLTSPNREQKIAVPRQVAMYLCRTLAGETLQQIADKFNKKDHTTVMAAEKRVRELLESDSKVKGDVATLSARLSP